MNFLFSKKQSSMAIVGALMITLGVQRSAAATTFNSAPLFDSAANYLTTIKRSDGGVDSADIYYPVLSDTDKSSLPIALLLQGALVDKSDYSNFANTVARYGFVVVVPNHIRTAISPMGAVTGLISEQQQVNDVLTYMQSENSNPASPIANLLDPSTLVLLGHSFGGAVGIAAIQGKCFAALCTEDFNRPEELKAGVFYGTNFRIGQENGILPAIDNDGIPIALIQGNRDGVAIPSNAELTYAQIQDFPKAFITIPGANHYGITNEDNLIREPKRPTLEQDVAIETIARWSALFLQGAALNNKDALDYVFNSGDTLDPNVSVTSIAKSIPEPTSVVSLLGLGVIGTSSLLTRKQKLVKK
ncbi:alpha/beta hydrolase [Nostoc sp. UHCC 0251]|uniref:alpha/beta hydrolase family protein n=1 Tax=Nostoc sp. UHCC 0251 TaxID=3110240 RepID=UPI002B1FABAA|nr:alpha/beta hydrolase [Nostoc sp. UHCC 0251]MEA5627971.1 alpha/beta hydrolase [Nostoc sp. UHCC 0251]